MMDDNQNLINIAPTWTPEECRMSPVGASRLIQEMADALQAVTSDRGAEDWEYRHAEVHEDGTVYTYGPKGKPDSSFVTAEAAWDEHLDDDDIIVRRRRAGDWEPVRDGIEPTLDSVVRQAKIDAGLNADEKHQPRLWIEHLPKEWRRAFWARQLEMSEVTRTVQSHG